MAREKEPDRRSDEAEIPFRKILRGKLHTEDETGISNELKN